MGVDSISGLFKGLIYGLINGDNYATINITQVPSPKSGVCKGNYEKMLANRRGKRQPGNGRSGSSNIKVPTSWDGWCPVHSN